MQTPGSVQPGQYHTPVPQEKVDNELRRLESDNSQNPVLKQNGSIHLCGDYNYACGDYKLTVNREKFSKLDIWPSTHITDYCAPALGHPLDNGMEKPKKSIYETWRQTKGVHKENQS